MSSKTWIDVPGTAITVKIAAIQAIQLTTPGIMPFQVYLAPQHGKRVCPARRHPSIGGRRWHWLIIGRRQNASRGQCMGEVRHNYRVLQAGRGLAALSVVAFHANMVCALPKYFGHEPAIFFRAGGSGVEFFFVLSGLVMVLAHRGDLGRDGAVRSFAWKRFRRIYPPLWAMLCIVLVILAAFPNLAAGVRPSAVETINAFAAGPVDPTIKEPLLSVEWTLRREMLFYVLFAVMLWRWRFGMAVIAGWLVLCVAAALVAMPYPASFVFDPVHLLFAMGMVVAWQVQRTSEIRGDRIFVATGAGLFALAWTWSDIYPADHALPLALWCYGLGASALSLGLISLERRGALVVPPALTALGDASYSIYLVHLVVVSALTKVAVVIARHVPLPGVVWWLAIVAAGVIAGIAFHVAVEKPLLRLISKRR
ncbi:acyltransferase [Novosphingobium sp. Fuku2-ISO-50]|uniref:acyltransferase family protein n=1 Tax=Novosphingobium sp. Fuku2-ISO-50 TaxID=1739114 RepID=UPI000A53BFB8|nr:acyltransferase [Novosphingobium sp. Fuku2-ISO-50]